MARPRKEATARRTEPVLVKLTLAERDRLSAEAAYHRVSSITALVRERALTGTVTVRQARELAAEDRVALNRVGVNLNQIARVLNEQGPRGVKGITGELQVTLARLNALLLRGAGDGPEPF